MPSPSLHSSATTALPVFTSNSGHFVIRKTIMNRNKFLWKQKGAKLKKKKEIKRYKGALFGLTIIKMQGMYK